MRFWGFWGFGEFVGLQVRLGMYGVSRILRGGMYRV